MAGELVVLNEIPVLSALFAPNPDAARRFVDFFTANIRNPHTRRAYARAAGEFAALCSGPACITDLRDIKPVHGKRVVNPS